MPRKDILRSGEFPSSIWEPLPGATANLYEGGSKVKSLKTGSDGSFSFRLEINKQYTIEIEKNGLISKRISFNTTMPDEEKGA